MAKRSVNQDRRDQAFDRAVQTPEVIDVGAVSEDQRVITTDGGILSAFVQGVAGFLERGNGLEVEADQLLVKAQAFHTPQTAAEDGILQRFVQTAREQKKAIEAHWEITSVFFRMHKRLVSFRERGASKAEKAGTIAQQLHNAYAEAERRRVAEENDRRTREAEAEAARRRDAEAEELEAQAVQREEAAADLSERERRFVELFAFGLNTGLTAARSAGFKEPAKSASRLLGMPKIVKAIKAAQEAQALRKQSEATRARPLDVREPVKAEAQIEKAGSDRVTWRVVCDDERVFVEAVIGGKHGIPADCLTVNQAKLTEYARSMHELINRWPGVRAVKSTTTV